MTILRKAEYAALKQIELSGSVIDLGGDTHSDYHRLFKGTHTITSANLDTRADMVLNLEEKLPLADASYDGALLINVLEHIFEYRQLISEVARILRPQGKIVIVVPFLFPIHPSPSDFHRYSKEALEKALSLAGFTDIQVTALGSGVCAVRWVLLERLLPTFLQPLSFIMNPLSHVLDSVFARVARAIGKKYTPADYPLGYVVTARLK